MPCKLSKRVPAEIWEPIAARIAAEYSVTTKALLFQDRARMFFVPRAKFWRELKDRPERYTLSAIAAITGHCHTTILSAFESANRNVPPAAINIPRKKIASLVGKIFGTLAVIAISAERRANQRVWTCRCKVCGETSDIITHALLKRTECPTCRRTKYSHRIEQATLHVMRRRDREGVTSQCR